MTLMLLLTVLVAVPALAPWFGVDTRTPELIAEVR